MRIRPIELRRGRHAQCHLWNTRRTLAEEPICGKPGRRIPALDILPQSNINGIVVLRDIAVDVVQSAVAHLNVNLAAEYQEEIPEQWNLTQGLKQYHVGSTFRYVILNVIPFWNYIQNH